MAFDDCYAVLGVPRDANRSQVRRAYRNLCYQFDPDRGDEASSTTAAMFRDVTEAFDTLCDAGARADHQREIAWRDVSGHAPGVRPAPLSPPRDLFDDFEDYRPSREAILRAFVDNVLDNLPKSRPVHPIRVEVAVAEPASGVIPFRVPAATACTTCEGSGRTGAFACEACDGKGVTWTTWHVDVPVTPRALPPDAASIPVSLAPIGVTSLFLDVTVRSSAPV
jgi:DnaJ-class molecular chaperone